MVKLNKKFFNRYTIAAFTLGVFVVSIILSLAYRSFAIPCLGNNVGVVKIIGEIDTEEDPKYYSVSSRDVIDQIEELDANTSIKGILLDVDSGGGSIESGERIMLALQRTSKPIVAVIRNVGGSSAYLIASAADKIYASRMSEVGSIGIKRNFVDISEKDKQEGITFYDISSGKYKSSVDEHNKITQDQLKVLKDEVMELHNIFTEYIAKNRNISIEKVREISTGRTYLGDDALKLNLIDAIGGMPEATEWLKNEIGEEPSYCYIGE